MYNYFKYLFLLVGGLILTGGAISCGSKGVVYASSRQSVDKVAISPETSKPPGDGNVKDASVDVANGEILKKKSISVSYCSECFDDNWADSSFPWPSNILNRNSTHELGVYGCPEHGFNEELSEIDSSVSIGKITVSKDSVRCFIQLTRFLTLHHVAVRVWASNFQDTISIINNLPVDVEGLELFLSECDDTEIDYSILQGALTRFTLLKYLKVESNSWEVLLSVQHLAALEELDLTIYDKGTKAAVISELSEHFLNGIQRLNITGHSRIVPQFSNIKMLKTGGLVELSELASMNDLEYLIFTPEKPVKKIPYEAWPHLKSFILGNHLVPIAEQKRFKEHHADAMTVFTTQDIVEEIFRKAKSIVVIHTISKKTRQFSTASEIDLFLKGFALSNNYPLVHYPRAEGGIGGLRCDGTILVIVETYAGQRELFKLGGCGNNIKWKHHEDLSFEGTMQTELCEWLSGLAMADKGSCRP